MIRGGIVHPSEDQPRWRQIEFPTHVDDRGCLTVAEVGDVEAAHGFTPEHLPFVPKRVYWLHNIMTSPENPTGTRGEHATFSSEQVIIPVAGSFSMLLDDGKFRSQIDLNASPTKPVGVHLMGGVWRHLTGFERGTVVLVMASTYYQDTHYVRDYAEFQRHASELRFMRRQAAKRDERHWGLGLIPDGPI